MEENPYDYSTIESREHTAAALCRRALSERAPPDAPVGAV